MRLFFHIYNKNILSLDLFFLNAEAIVLNTIPIRPYFLSYKKEGPFVSRFSKVLISSPGTFRVPFLLGLVIKRYFLNAFILPGQFDKPIDI